MGKFTLRMYVEAYFKGYVGEITLRGVCGEFTLRDICG